MKTVSQTESRSQISKYDKDINGEGEIRVRQNLKNVWKKFLEYPLCHRQFFWK